MSKLSADEIRMLALEAAKIVDVDNLPPYHRFDDEVCRMYQRYLRAKEVIEAQENTKG